MRNETLRTGPKQKQDMRIACYTQGCGTINMLRGKTKAPWVRATFPVVTPENATHLMSYLRSKTKADWQREGVRGYCRSRATLRDRTSGAGLPDEGKQRWKKKIKKMQRAREGGWDQGYCGSQERTRGPAMPCAILSGETRDISQHFLKASSETTVPPVYSVYYY